VIFDPYLKEHSPFYYSLRLLKQDLSGIVECEFLQNLHLKGCYPISMHFEAPAWVYTLKNLDTVQEVMLPRLISLARGELRGSTHIVKNIAPHTLSTQDLPFRYPPEDPRFDQIQTYYWVDQALQYGFNIFQIKNFKRIEVHTFFGFPEVINAAFAFQNQIRMGRGDGVSFRYLAQDPSIMIHEVGHALLNQIVNLPTQGEGGSLNEAFADYFSATVINSPKMGSRSFLKGPYERSLNQKRSYKELSHRLYEDSLVISSALWEIETLLGKNKTNELFIQTLVQLGPAEKIQEFVTVFESVIQKLPSVEDQDKVLWILLSRDWPVTPRSKL
jgi:hypothetical protein